MEAKSRWALFWKCQASNSSYRLCKKELLETGSKKNYEHDISIIDSSCVVIQSGVQQPKHPLSEKLGYW